MARWRLTADHYLAVKGTTYRRTEMALGGGEEAVADLPVPRLLEIGNPNHWTDKAEGIIVVAHEGSKVGRDWVFAGDPTPDMEPMDAEAEEITKSLRAKWGQTNTVDLSGSEDYGKKLMDVLMAREAKVPEPSADIAELLKSNTAVMAEMAKVLGALAQPRRI